MCEALQNCDVSNDAQTAFVEDAPESRTKAFDAESPDALSAYLRTLHKRPLLTKAEEIALGTRIAHGDRAAHRLLVEGNLRLVVMIARRSMRKARHLSFLDLIAEGNIGLMHAADKFDPDRGYRFSTYAVWWIRQTIERAIMNHDRIVRTPVHIRKRTDRLLAVTQSIIRQTGRAPSVSELADRTRIPAAEIPRLQALMYDTTVSGDESWDEDGRHTFLDSLIDTSQKDYSDHVARKEAAIRLHRAMAKLPRRQQQVLRLRYGIPDGDTHTLEGIATLIGVTRERVRQIQLEAMQKLRVLLNIDADSI
jgi:RNA polymerase nonessential primary-like sigma factor